MIANGVLDLPESLSAQVRAFLRDYIESYEQLEILFILRAQPGDAWSVEQLAERLQLSREAVEEALQALTRAGGINERAWPEEPVRYLPRNAEQAATIDSLATAYESNPLAIIKLMSANAIDRVRTAAIHTFANAFVIGRKKDG
jgi:DNA-binding MarR family transcriptional regulator